jgi:hypothetical protein
VQVSTDVENDIQLEMPMDHVITPFIEAQPEAWTQHHLVWRDDRQHGYALTSTEAALDTLVPDVATYTRFETEAERDHYAPPLRGGKSPMRPTASSTSGET